MLEEGRGEMTSRQMEIYLFIFLYMFQQIIKEKEIEDTRGK